MCGIAGVITSAWTEALAPALRRAIGRIRHRGPDDEGFAWLPDPPVDGQPGVALANRRLAIIDLSASGHQPMVSGDGRWTVTTEVLGGGPVRTYLFQTGAGGDISFVPGRAQ